MTPEKQKHWKMEKGGHRCIEEKGGPSRFLCLVLLRLKRRSISRSGKISTSVLLSQHVLKLLLKLILGFKCTAPFSVRNVAMVWEEKTTIGKCFCRKGAFKKVKKKISGVYIQIQNIVLHVISGEKLPDLWILPLAELNLGTIAVMKPFWMAWGNEGTNE